MYTISIITSLQWVNIHTFYMHFTIYSHNLSEHLQEGAFNALSDTVKEFLENLSSVRVVDVRHEQIIVSYNIHNNLLYPKG